MKFIFIADFFVDQVLGGGELNNEEVINQLIEKNHTVAKVNSHIVTPKLINDNKDTKYIVSNFVNLSPSCREVLMEKCDYVIYEHDHKYLKTRNPAVYENYKAPQSEIINLDFYANANATFCQSSFHKSIIERNIDINNVISLSGNLWSKDALSIMSEMAKCDKKDVCSVMNSTIPHKNTKAAIQYCEVKNLNYELVSSNNYEMFLRSLGANRKFIFFPLTPETLSRVAVEARMMNMSVIVNKQIGAAYEPWFSLKGLDLINEVEMMRERIPNTVAGAF